jgi:hypothetical protein
MFFKVLLKDIYHVNTVEKGQKRIPGLKKASTIADLRLANRPGRMHGNGKR